MYFDIHTHILPGMDDGAEDIARSVEMLKAAAEENENGVLFATPHFIYGAVQGSPELVLSKCLELQEMTVKLGININICPGNEIFLSAEVPLLLEKGRVTSLNKSRYILVELPMMNVPDFTDEVIYDLQLMGYLPILAHPERNREISQNPEILYSFVTRGILAQVNSTSLRGMFGNSVRDTAFLMLKHNLVHFVASDAHSSGGRSTKLNTAYKLVSNEFGTDTAQRLFYTNGLAVYDDRDIIIPDPVSFTNHQNFVKRIFAPFQKILAR